MLSLDWKIENAFTGSRGPGDIAFATYPELELQLVTSVLRGTLRFLQALKPISEKLLIIQDWRDHDGLELGQETREMSFLFEISKSPKELFDSTPKDDMVFLRAHPLDSSWDLRIRTDWNDTETGMFGDLQLILPSPVAREFNREFSDKNMWPIYPLDSDGKPMVLLPPIAE